MNIITFILLIVAIATGVLIGNNPSLYKRIILSIWKICTYLVEIFIFAGIVYVAILIISSIWGSLSNLINQLNTYFNGKFFYYLFLVLIILTAAIKQVFDIRQDGLKKVLSKEYRNVKLLSIILIVSFFEMGFIVASVLFFLSNSYFWILFILPILVVGYFLYWIVKRSQIKII